MEATTAWLFCIVFIFEAFLAQKNVEIFGKRHPVEEMSVEYRGWFRVPHPESVGFFLATNEICSRTLSYSRTKPPPPLIEFQFSADAVIRLRGQRLVLQQFLLWVLFG